VWWTTLVLKCLSTSVQKLWENHAWTGLSEFKFGLVRAHASDVAPTPPTVRAHAEASPLRPSVPAWCLGHCVSSMLTRSKAVGRCQAFHPHPLAGAPPCRHWPRYWPHVAAPVRCTPAMPRPTPWLTSTWCPSYRLNRLEPAIKAPSFLHAREHRAGRRPP
jgi:hypothetical protein